MKYDVIIIGAGPGGIFSAYELLIKTKTLKLPYTKQVSRFKKGAAPLTVKK